MSRSWLTEQAALLSGEEHPCTVFGECLFKENCAYAHFPRECCRHFLKGKCKADRCRGLHLTEEDINDMVRMGLFGPKRNANGRRSPSRHSDDAPAVSRKRPRASGDLPARLQAIVPRLSGQLHPCERLGPCMFGSDCDLRDVPYEACRHFLKGRCRFGKECDNLHIDFDDIDFLREVGLLNTKRRSTRSPPPYRPTSGAEDRRHERRERRSPERSPSPDSYTPRRLRDRENHRSRNDKKMRFDSDRFEYEFHALKSLLSGRRHPCTKYGTCQFGGECQYLRVPFEVCRLHLKGKCQYSGADCRDVHLSWEILDNCRLLEDTPSEPPVDIHALSGKRHPCLRYGDCQFGDGCTYREVPMEVCRYHLKGKCKRPESCPDVHVSWTWLDDHGFGGAPNLEAP